MSVRYYKVKSIYTQRTLTACAKALAVAQELSHAEFLFGPLLLSVPCV
jgi:hypothetical protein